MATVTSLDTGGPRTDGGDVTAPRTAPSAIDRDIVATVALTLYSLAVAAGFARVFSGWGFFADLALLAVVGHGVSFALRRARVSGWVSVPIVSLLMLWMLIALHYGISTRNALLKPNLVFHLMV